MKGGVAALVTAACRLAASGQPLAGDLVVAITADEERNCLGAEELVKEPLFDGLGAALVAEPTGLQLFIAEKGAFWLEVTLSGKTAHGSMPHLGANAIAPMARFLVRWTDYYAALEHEHPLLGRPTLNIGTLQGGVKANVVPDRCTAELDMRTVPPLDHHTLRHQAEVFLTEICEDHPGVRFETRMRSNRPAISCPEDSPLARALAGAVRDLAGVEPRPQGVPYCTEACIWVPHLNIPAVICGPGEPGMAHQPDDWVSATHLELAAAVYERVARELLGPGRG
jgi:succinyl-diaminopimelate desuccinylase